MLPTITRETRFSELPQHIKQKIINIQRNSYQHYGSTEPLKHTKFNYLYSQTQDLQTRNLQRNFNLIAENAEKLKRMWSQNVEGIDFKYIHVSLRKALDQFKENVMLYKKNEGNREFVDEMVLTYAMLNNKLEALSKERRI